MPESDANKLVLDVDSIPDDDGPTIGQVMDAARRIELDLEVSAAERAAVGKRPANPS